MFSFDSTVVLCPLIMFLVLVNVPNGAGHGRMMDPPSRNAMWRFGYPSPVNYDDNQNWCGGAAVMINENHGKCGICGDNYADPSPRAHEAGGMYASGIVVKRYSPGQLLDVEIELTANHQGTFQFKVCPADNPKEEVNQACLDGHVLELFNSDGKIGRSYIIDSPDKRKTFYLKVKLPEVLSCSQCVMQWTYVAANTWGVCDNGTEAVGCGPQETFINCADVAIIPNTGARPPLSPPSNALYYTKNASTGEVAPLVVRSQLCLASPSFLSALGKNANSTLLGDEYGQFDEWCHKNCLRYPPNCPSDRCSCIESCEPVGEFSNQVGSELYCMQNCLKYPREDCTEDKCVCH